MAIEDDEPKDREVWNNVAKFWYHKASDKTPTVGRLYHHLAILARPYSLEQLSLYTKSLTSVIPFNSARGSIMTLFNPILQNKETTKRRQFSFETLFIKAHAILFTSRLPDLPNQFRATIRELEGTDLFERYISKAATRFKETGAYIALSNIAALFEYGYAKDGKSKSKLVTSFESARLGQKEASKSTPTDLNDLVDHDQPPGPQYATSDTHIVNESNENEVFISQSSRLTTISLDVCLKYPGNGNIYPLIHMYLVFFWSLTIVQQDCIPLEQENILRTIEKAIPWIGICLLPNTLAEDSQVMTPKVQRKEFPQPYKDFAWPLPEDYIMQGLLFVQWYFPGDWFTTAMVDDDERSHDLPSMAQPRKERMLWLGYHIATVCSITLLLRVISNSI